MSTECFSSMWDETASPDGTVAAPAITEPAQGWSRTYGTFKHINK